MSTLTLTILSNAVTAIIVFAMTRIPVEVYKRILAKRPYRNLDKTMKNIQDANISPIEQKLKTQLEPIFKQRVYAVKAPPKVKAPFCIYRFIGEEKIIAFEGEALACTEFEIKIKHANRTESIELENQVIQSLKSNNILKGNNRLEESYDNKLYQRTITIKIR